MSHHRSLRFGAWAALAAMLFAQAALALAACNAGFASPWGEPGGAVSVTAEATAPCHEQAAVHEALCAAHRQASEPVVESYQFNIPVIPVQSLKPAQARVLANRTVLLPPEGEPAASPPARILFQSLLI